MSAGPALVLLFDGLDQVRRQVGAVGIERVREPAHRPAHGLLDVHLLDVVVDDMRHDVVEDPQVLIGVVLATAWPR